MNERVILHLSIPAALRRELRILAAADDVQLNEYVKRVLVAHVERNKK